MEKAGTVNIKVWTRTIPRHLEIWGRTRKIKQVNITEARERGKFMQLSKS